MSKTPQQQAEELFFNLESSYNPGIYVSIIADLIQAKEERDALRREVDLKAEPDGAGTIAARLNFWKASCDDLHNQVADLRNMVGAPAFRRIRSLESERDQLKQQVELAKKIAAELFDIVESFSPKHPIVERLHGGLEYVHKSKLEQLQSTNDELVKFKERLEWLHSNAGELDSEGYEWGVARVKFDASGRFVTFQWTNSDHSDLDSAMKGSK